MPGEIEQVFGNDPIDIDFDVVNGEERWTLIGHTNAVRVLVIVWTMRGEIVRPISAFEAGRRLIDEYRASKGWH